MTTFLTVLGWVFFLAAIICVIISDRVKDKNIERKMIKEKTKTIKIRLYSEEDYASNSIDWLILTEEQFRLLEYLANNDCLADCIDSEVCNDADFTTV